MRPSSRWADALEGQSGRGASLGLWLHYSGVCHSVARMHIQKDQKEWKLTLKPCGIQGGILVQSPWPLLLALSTSQIISPSGDQWAHHTSTRRGALRSPHHCTASVRAPGRPGLRWNRSAGTAVGTGSDVLVAGRGGGDRPTAEGIGRSAG